jgi:cytidine deaminase
MTDDELIAAAKGLAGEFRPGRTCVAGDVAAAILSRGGNLYTGICVDASCSVGFCAEHAAVAEMLKARESEIEVVVAVDDEGKILPPCGRCRELMWQVNPVNAEARVILGPLQSVSLFELLPYQHQSVGGGKASEHAGASIVTPGRHSGQPG